jgi:hypothetical protein
VSAILKRTRVAIEREEAEKTNREIRKFCVEEAVEQTCYIISANDLCSMKFSKYLENKNTQQILIKEVLAGLEEFV